MELGEGGDGTEAREVRSVTETVESRAREAETAAHAEAVRRTQEAVERREQAAAEHAGEGSEQAKPDPLDEAMHEHHEKKAEGHGQPAHDKGHAEHAHQEGDGQQPGARAQAPVQDSTWKPAPPEGAGGSDEELRVSHAPREGSEQEKHEDTNA